MLATLVDAPFDDPAWLFEVKWDGFRAICSIDAEGTVSLTSRNGLDLLHRFKELETLGSAFRSLPAVIDGEICALDAEGHLVVSSAAASRQAGARPRARTPLTFVAFDLLYADGRDLRSLPLEERKAKLEALIVDGSRRAVFAAHHRAR